MSYQGLQFTVDFGEHFAHGWGGNCEPNHGIPSPVQWTNGAVYQETVSDGTVHLTVASILPGQNKLSGKDLLPFNPFPMHIRLPTSILCLGDRTNSQRRGFSRADNSGGLPMCNFNAA